MDAAEQFACDYLKQRRLRAERFTRREMGSGKTPDYKVFNQSWMVAYCEAKHIGQDDWLYEQLRAQPTQLAVGGLRSDPMFNRLTTHIHRAVKQFVSVNPSHEYPNILFFENSDSTCPL